MAQLLLQILVVLYASVGIVNAIAYFPTIKDLWFEKKPSANISSYIIWTACSAVSFSYALFILSDLLVRIVTGLNLVCCIIILFLSIGLRYRNKKSKRI